MKEYEITENDNKVGKIKLFKNNIVNDMFDSLIESVNGNKYQIIKDYKCQTYEVSFNVNDVDELYDIVSVYESGDIFNEIEEIKKYNNIKSIRKDSLIKVVIPEIYLSNYNISKNNIDLESLLFSKIYFVSKASNNQEIDNIKNDYKNYLNSNEYEFLVEEEKDEVINTFIKRVDKLIKEIEISSNFKYGKDYIFPIKIK